MITRIGTVAPAILARQDSVSVRYDDAPLSDAIAAAAGIVERQDRHLTRNR